MEYEKEYEFPFKLHDYQIESVKETLEQPCSLLKHTVGLGKSAIAIASALEKSENETGVQRIIILCPPILIDQWHAFLSTIKGLPEALMYRGTPIARRAMDLELYSIIIVSYNIFRGKQDHNRFVKLAEKGRIAFIADELSLKSLQSQTYRKLKKIIYRKMRLEFGAKAYHELLALNATPISDPSHVYNWSSMMVPGVYQSKRLFLTAHAVDVDHWGKVTKWDNLDLLERNMNLFSIDSPDGVLELPEINYNVVPYELSPKHMKVYKDVEAAQWDQLPEDKVELALNSMFSTLQRLVVAPEEFEIDNCKSPLFDFLDSYLDQIGDDQVIIFTRHVIVSKMLHEYIPGSVAIYGGVSATARTEAFKDLRSGAARVLVANADSVGHGLDLQFMNRIVFAELPFREDRFVQAVGRVHRQGQKNPCFITIPLAKNTIQDSIYYNLLKNSDTIKPVMNTKQSIREFLLTK